MSASASKPHNSHVQTDKWYSGLDPGIRFAVRVLHAQGIETGQSCEGGEGHAYDRPTIDLLGYSPGVGFAAFAALTAYGLRVRDIAVLWSADKDLLGENFWRITLWQAWPERSEEKPMFVWSYSA